MESAMVVMFPEGIRILIVDDDAKFLKSATMLLSVLNFEAVRCSSTFRALKSLRNRELEGFDAILVHPVKATACNFDFRAIIEAELLIPVIYFIPMDHHATGNEADELLHTLQAGTYIIKKPVGTNELRTLLWMAIGWRKSVLEASNSKRAAANAFELEAGLNVEGKDEDHAHHKVARCRRVQKRKGSSNISGSTGTAATGGHLSAKGKEKDNVASQQQNNGQGKKFQTNNGGGVFKLPQPNEAMMNAQQSSQHHYNSKFFTNANVSPYNPYFFLDTAGSSRNVGTSNASTLSTQHLVYSATPSSLPPMAHQQQHQLAAHNTIFGNNVPLAAAPTMTAAPAIYKPQLSQCIGNQQPHHHQDMLVSAEKSGHFTFSKANGGMTSGASSSATEARAFNSEINFSFLQYINLGTEQHGNEDVAGTVGMDKYASMANPPMAPQLVNDPLDNAEILKTLFSAKFSDYKVRSPLVDQILGLDSSVSDGLPFISPDRVLGLALNVDELIAIAGGAFGSTNVASFMVPQDLSARINGGTTNIALFMVPHQDLGSMPNGGSSNAASSMVFNVSGLTIEGGAFRNNSSAPLMAPRDLEAESNGGSNNATLIMSPYQDIGAMSNGDQLALGNNNKYGSFMGYQVEAPNAMTDGDDTGFTASMLPSDQYEENTSFPLDALLDDLHGRPIFEFDDVNLDALLGSSIDGSVTAANGAATTSPAIDEEEGGSVDVLDNLVGLEIPHDVFQLNGYIFP